jgi:hypothetical protein
MANGVLPKLFDREGRAEDPLKGIEGWAGSSFPLIFRRLPSTTPKQLIHPTAEVRAHYFRGTRQIKG